MTIELIILFGVACFLFGYFTAPPVAVVVLTLKVLKKHGLAGLKKLEDHFSQEVVGEYRKNLHAKNENIKAKDELIKELTADNEKQTKDCNNLRRKIFELANPNHDKK